MPNIKSAKKRVLVNETKAARNKAAKSALKTQIKKFDAVVAEGNRSEADVVYKATVKAIDKAAAKGLLHKNNAANKKSAMTIRPHTQSCGPMPIARNPPPSAGGFLLPFWSNFWEKWRKPKFYLKFKLKCLTRGAGADTMPMF